MVLTAVALAVLAVAGIVAWRSGGGDAGGTDGVASGQAGTPGTGSTASGDPAAPAVPREGCVALEINASLEKGELLGELATRYNRSGRTFDGGCAEVSVHRTTSGVSMQGLLDGWDPDRLAAPTPQVWTPTSSLWVSLLRQRAREQGGGAPGGRRCVPLDRPEPVVDRHAPAHGRGHRLAQPADQLGRRARPHH